MTPPTEFPESLDSGWQVQEGALFIVPALGSCSGHLSPQEWQPTIVRAYGEVTAGTSWHDFSVCVVMAHLGSQM